MTTVTRFGYFCFSNSCYWWLFIFFFYFLVCYILYVDQLEEKSSLSTFGTRVTVLLMYICLYLCFTFAHFMSSIHVPFPPLLTHCTVGKYWAPFWTVINLLSHSCFPSPFLWFLYFGIFTFIYILHLVMSFYLSVCFYLLIYLFLRFSLPLPLYL